MVFPWKCVILYRLVSSFAIASNSQGGEGNPWGSTRRFATMALTVSPQTLLTLHSNAIRVDHEKTLYINISGYRQIRQNVFNLIVRGRKAASHNE